MFARSYWPAAYWPAAYWPEGAEGPAQPEEQQADSGAGSGKYRPTDQEIIDWLQSMFPRTEQEAKQPTQETAEAPQRRVTVEVSPEDLEEYSEALAGLSRVRELFDEYTEAWALYQADRRRKRKEREAQRAQAKLAALVAAYIKRQRDDETALILILSECI